MENEITNLPEKIYLNLGKLTDDETDFRGLKEVTWNPESIDEYDPCYVHITALQALETALKPYLHHKAWGTGACASYCGQPCTCGLDQLLTTNPKEERK